MRRRSSSSMYWVTLAVTGLSVTGIVASGCGSDATTTPADAGNDIAVQDVTVLDTSKADAGVDAPIDAPPEACAVDADLATASFPDAAIGGDASVGTCITCARTNCGSQIMSCDMDCSCKTTLGTFFGCVGGGMTPQKCAGPVLQNQAAQSLGLCVYSSCQNECGLAGMFKDGGSDAPTEAATMEAGD